MADIMTIEVVENNDFAERFQLTADGEALDLTGRTLEAYARSSRDVDDADSLLLTSGSGITIVDGPTGIIDVSMSWAQVEPMRHLRIDVISSGKRRSHIIAYLSPINT